MFEVDRRPSRSSKTIDTFPSVAVSFAYNPNIFLLSELPASALETEKQQNHQEPNDEITASICSPDKEATDDNSR